MAVWSFLSPPPLNRDSGPSTKAWLFFVGALAAPYTTRAAFSSTEMVFTKVVKDGAFADKRNEDSLSLRFSSNFDQNPNKGRMGFSKGIDRSDFGERVVFLFRTLNLRAL